MADTINIPKIGPVKAVYVWGAGALVAGIVGYAWWQSRAATSGPQDAESEELVDEYPPPVPGGPREPADGSPDPDDPARPPRSNAEWAQRATTRLGELGYEPGPVAVAIGKYFARRGLSAAEADMINVARSQLGPPPVGDWPVVIDRPSKPTPPAPTPPKVPPRPAPIPVPPKPRRDPRYVQTARYTSRNPPWNSTLSGIARHERTTVLRLLTLNPGVKDANKIPYPGRIRIA